MSTKILGIGDNLISADSIEKAFLNEQDFKLSVLQWPVSTINELQEININVEQNGPNIDINPNIDELIIKENPDILLVHFYPVNKKLIESCPNLKIIGVLRGGIENIDTQTAKNKSIDIINTEGRNSNAVAEFTIGMILSTIRNIAFTFKDLKTDYDWRKSPERIDNSREIPYLTFGIIGYGYIGKRVVELLKGLGAKNICVYDPNYLNNNQSDINFVNLDTLLKQSDVISLHARLTKKTKHMISKSELENMKPTSYIINTARSGLIDEDALVEVLSKGKIAGAALDTFDEEPLRENNSLLKLNNLLCTPHIAGSTKDAFSQTPVKWIEKYKKLSI